MTEAELAAINGLYAGNLKPLGDLLARCGDRLHPAIVLRLRVMINGDATESDWQLYAKRHPKLRKGQSNAERSFQIRKELATALAMVKNGALGEGAYEAAVSQTAEDLGIGRSTVEAHWTEQRGHILRDIQTGIISSDVLPSPISERHGVRPGELADFYQP